MFKIKAYGKSDFAWMMFPKMRNPSAAQDKLLRWIKKDYRFHKKILRLATTKDDNNYSKEEVLEGMKSLVREAGYTDISNSELY